MLGTSTSSQVLVLNYVVLKLYQESHSGDHKFQSEHNCEKNQCCFVYISEINLG